MSGCEIVALRVPVPAPGEFRLLVWRRDAAGNEAEDNASVPVMLRYDPEPPQLGVRAAAGERSHPGRGARDRSGLRAWRAGRSRSAATGSGTWQTLATELQGDRLLARIDDAALPAGDYALRARAADQAGNEASTDRRARRAADAAHAAAADGDRAAGRRRAAARRSRGRFAAAASAAGAPRDHRAAPGRPRADSAAPAHIAGPAHRSGRQRASPARRSRCSRAAKTSADQPIGVVRTDRRRRLPLHDHGQQHAHPAVRLPRLAADAARLRPRSACACPRPRARCTSAAGACSTARLSPSRGRRAQPAGPGRRQARRAAGPPLRALADVPHQTHRPGRRWSIPYRFRRTRGMQRFRFRLRLPRETGYPFEPGASRSVTVRVRGR